MANDISTLTPLAKADSTIPATNAKVQSRTAKKIPWAKWLLRTITIVYLGFLVIWPLTLVFTTTFADGVEPFLDTLRDPVVSSALKLTALAAAFAVVFNVLFGLTISILLVRYEFPGKRALSALVDLPLSVSPVVVGLALILVYNGRDGWLGVPIEQGGFQILFATPSIVLATAFISLPLVIREVVPVLQEVGTDQEQAARSLGANGPTVFWRITLPAIKWGLVYGVVLSLARAIGEFGAVKVVSGNLIGRTQTGTLVVEQLYQDFDTRGAFAIAAVLAAVSIVIIVVVSFLRPAHSVKGEL